MAIYLVRHGHAGDRASWSGDDVRRPLSAKGWRQAEHLASLLEDRPVGSIYSSPATRCVETMEPLAKKLHLPVIEVRELFEGRDVDKAIRFMFKRADENPVLCSHGDLIPKIIRRLVGAGMRRDDTSESRKGSVWMLELDGNDVVKGHYHPPED